MQKNHFRLLTVAAMLTATISLSAQVRIGGGKPVTPGALFDLNSPTKGTVLFPHVFIDDLDFIPNSIGAHPDSLDVNYNLAGSVVFNTNPATVTGMYLWDGEYWLKIDTADKPLPPPDPYAYCSTLYAAPDDNTGKTAQLILGSAAGDTLTFLTYNLGADPDMTPFQQMTYNYPWATNATDSALIPFDVRINGGLFQWGRKDFTHAFRCQKEDGVNDDKFSTTKLNYPPDADNGKFITSTDWVTTSQNNLWNSSKTGNHDPCPDGFYVPAMSRWTTLTNSNKICWFNRPTATYANQPYVAIPVQNGVWKSDYRSDVSYDTNYSNYFANNGIAIYTDTAYTALIGGGGNGTVLTDQASFGGTLHEPVLFLPANGYRRFSNGKVYYTGSYGNYWSTSVGGSNTSISQSFMFNNVSTGNNTRGYGYAVRCIAQ